jgi:hypothetical protein
MARPRPNIANAFEAAGDFRLERNQYGRSASFFQIWSGPLPQTLIWIKHRPSPVAIVSRIYAVWFTGS